MHYVTFPAPKAEHPALHADLYVLVLDYGVHGNTAYAQAQQTATLSGLSQNSALLLHNYNKLYHELLPQKLFTCITYLYYISLESIIIMMDGPYDYSSPIIIVSERTLYDMQDRYYYSHAHS